MITSAPTDKFAAYLRMLKDRSGRGFDRLGKQAGVSGSSLHRYCSGLSVPADYRVVHSFAKVCGASGEELRELHRLWALADAGKDVERRGGRNGSKTPEEGGRPWSGGGRRRTRTGACRPNTADVFARPLQPNGRCDRR